MGITDVFPVSCGLIFCGILAIAEIFKRFLLALYRKFADLFHEGMVQRGTIVL